MVIILKQKREYTKKSNSKHVLKITYFPLLQKHQATTLMPQTLIAQMEKKKLLPLNTTQMTFSHRYTKRFCVTNVLLPRHEDI